MHVPVWCKKIKIREEPNNEKERIHFAARQAFLVGGLIALMTAAGVARAQSEGDEAPEGEDEVCIEDTIVV